MGYIAGQERRVRSLFVSDVHLGCRHSQAEHFLEFLKQYRPQYLYVVGDFFDGWRLKRRWRWRPEYDLVLKRLLSLRRSGTQLYYTPGNHDAFLRGFLSHLSGLRLVRVRNQFVHTCADRRRFLVTHGDQFDKIEQNAPWLSFVSCFAYDVLLTANRWVNRLCRKSRDSYTFSAGVKRRVKWLVRHFSAFEDQLVRAAHDHGCHGIICGHIHQPRIRPLDDVVYCNTGDWVESCSALVEHEDGRFELVHRDGTVIGRLAAREVPTPTAPWPATPSLTVSTAAEDGALVA